MRFLVIALLLTVRSFAFADSVAGLHVTEVCALNSAGMNQTDRLAKIKNYLDLQPFTGLVNQTQGSYVIIDTSAQQMTISFYTSGFFDIVAIHREGPIQFCDDGTKVVMKGLDREDEIKIENDKVVLGDGGAKKTFEKGRMPLPLATLHHYIDRSIASEHP